MISSLEDLEDEAVRLAAFPVAEEKVFLAHAGVTALPACVGDAVVDYTNACTRADQEYEGVLRRIGETREVCARTIGAKANEIALLGPTSLGLSLFANGLTWEEGDEIICYRDDYPANVYPWQDLERRGVKPVYLEPESPGEITPELLAGAMTERTRLVALASCHFLSGYRIDVDGIGKLVHERGALFSLDAIQTIGAFPTRVDHVDFLSADAHKWMLGPLVAGIVYVDERQFERLRPTLLGAWNVRSPQFIAQDEIRFEAGARRYEPGVLNCAGLFGMRAALEMMERVGSARIAERLMTLKAELVAGLKERGFKFLGPEAGPNASAITTVWREELAIDELFGHLSKRGVSASLRQDRAGRAYIRFSPHFYNTLDEIGKVMGMIDEFLGMRD